VGSFETSDPLEADTESPLLYIPVEAIESASGVKWEARPGEDHEEGFVLADIIPDTQWESVDAVLFTKVPLKGLVKILYGNLGERFRVPRGFDDRLADKTKTHGRSKTKSCSASTQRTRTGALTVATISQRLYLGEGYFEHFKWCRELIIASVYLQILPWVNALQSKLSPHLSLTTLDSTVAKKNSLVVCDESGHTGIPFSLAILSWDVLWLIRRIRLSARGHSHYKLTPSLTHIMELLSNLPPIGVFEYCATLRSLNAKMGHR